MKNGNRKIGGKAVRFYIFILIETLLLIYVLPVSKILLFLQYILYIYEGLREKVLEEPKIFSPSFANCFLSIYTTGWHGHFLVIYCDLAFSALRKFVKTHLIFFMTGFL